MSARPNHPSFFNSFSVRTICSLPLLAAVAACHPATSANQASDAEAGWRSLPLITDGNIDASWSHTGWGGLIVDDGSLRTDCDPKGLGLLVYTKERLGNCQIRVVFKTKNAQSNAGVYVRIGDGILDQLGKTGPAFDRDATGKPSAATLEQVKAAAAAGLGPWYAVSHGYEVQIKDDDNPLHRTGAIYSLAPAVAVSSKAPDEWKTLVITLAGNRIFVELDGKRITRFDPASPDVPPQKEWYEPEREPIRPEAGYLGLQNHDPGDVVWYKEVSVRPLPEGLK